MTQFSSDFEPCSISGARRARAGRGRLSLALAAAALALTGLAASVEARPPVPGTTETPALSTPELQQLWEAEQTWVRALTTNTPALLEQLVDAELSFIGPDGQLEDREAYLAGYRALPSQGVVVRGIDLHEVKMRILGQTGIVTGRVVARVQMGQQSIVENVRFTRVYARRGQSWRMVAGQGTRLAPATGS
jgi:uncharacterized protein DUF4440